MKFDYEIEKINTINISNEEFNIHKISSNVRKSIALYNKSVINFKGNLVDLAIVDLKKSLSLNPDFSEAIKLLGICYVYKKNFKKAKKLFKKLARYDMYSASANKYLKEIKTKNSPKRFAVAFLATIIIIPIAALAYCNRSNIQSMFNKSQKAELEKNKKLEQQKAISGSMSIS